jgi:hypothetical protein
LGHPVPNDRFDHPGFRESGHARAFTSSLPAPSAARIAQATVLISADTMQELEAGLMGGHSIEPTSTMRLPVSLLPSPYASMSQSDARIQHSSQLLSRDESLGFGGDSFLFSPTVSQPTTEGVPGSAPLPESAVTIKEPSQAVDRVDRSVSIDVDGDDGDTGIGQCTGIAAGDHASNMTTGCPLLPSHAVEFVALSTSADVDAFLDTVQYSDEDSGDEGAMPSAENQDAEPLMAETAHL